MRRTVLFGCAILITWVTGCSFLENSEEEVATEAVAAEVVPKKPDNVVCVLPPSSLPIWDKENQFVISRFSKTCKTEDGKDGVEKNTPWVAMGFPCTAGGGKVDVTGNYFDPKMVSFILASDCPMSPQDLQTIQKSGNKILGFDENTKILAFIPFATHYWEVEGIRDADVSFTVDFRSVEALQRMWKEFRDKGVFSVKLYGRENSWIPGEPLVYIQAEIKKEGQRVFKLNPLEVRTLNKDELERSRLRCETLQPPRNCAQVFE